MLRSRSRCAAFVLFLVLSACGKVGDPRPPFIRIPEAVKDLSVTQSGYQLILSWTNPPRYVDGSAATNLARVRIQSDGASVATVNVNASGQPQSYAILVPMPGGLRTFSVVVETDQGKLSEVSNTASIRAIEIPGKISNLMATPDQRRIFLKWDKPQDHPELVDAYIVSRSDIPAESESVTQTSYEDMRYPTVKTVTYNVTAARRMGETVVMGVGPESATISVEDKTPPRVPTGLEIRESDKGAFLIWDLNTETDLAGYKVFRSDRDDSGFRAISEKLVMTNGLFDASYHSGVYYAVSAVDEFGNESAMSAPFRGP